MRVEFSFWLFSPRDASVGAIDGLPPFLSISFHERAKEAPRFVLAPPLLDVLSPAARVAVDRARTLYVVRVDVDERLPDDVHLQAAIQTAAQIAEHVDAIVVDPHAMRATSAAAFGETCAPGIEHHVSFAVEGRRAVSRGMRKFGVGDVEVDLTGVEPHSMNAALTLVEAVCGALVAGTVRVGEPFELATTTWSLDVSKDRLALRPMRAPIATVLTWLAKGSH
jgi:hypothetical protein